VILNSCPLSGSLFLSDERRHDIADIYIKGKFVVTGPYSRAYRGGKVASRLVRQVPVGYLDFFVFNKYGEKVRRRLTKEEFSEQAEYRDKSERENFKDG
jgi:hypothetical protein